MASHMFVALSSHSFGHIGQTAPVMEALRARLPELRVTLCTRSARFEWPGRFVGAGNLGRGNRRGRGAGRCSVHGLAPF